MVNYIEEKNKLALELLLKSIYLLISDKRKCHIVSKLKEILEELELAINNKVLL